MADEEKKAATKWAPKVGDLVWDGDRPGLLLASREDGTSVVGYFAAVVETTGDFSNLPPEVES